MAIPRPYGVGLYGTGHYSRYAGNVYEVGGASSILFGVTGSISTVIRPWAITQIVWDVWAEHLTPNWALPAPCEPGEWLPADPCETGAWTAPGPCSPGTWAPKPLVRP